jgi:hypothetical protein
MSVKCSFSISPLPDALDAAQVQLAIQELPARCFPSVFGRRRHTPGGGQAPRAVPISLRHLVLGTNG